ncbi:phosphotransferase [Lederbergia citrea]|uniref:Aminoglycoside phosphotransferase family protein n=1 Tax=Lederbergia citrea TaxID=2833581 RepID=A0A942UTI2_9BACI|nr:phosphotransferase [Lederbergia citrea]MBS4223654.1 aminoglycoside phosphotransferase family protein [Lederbergia citrea]
MTEGKMAVEIAESFLNEEVTSLEPILGKGSVNTIYIARTKSTEIVVRMNSDSRSFKDYQKERWCIEQASAKGIPSPTVLTMGQRGEVAYMIQTFIAGEHGEDSDLDRNGLWRKLGEYAKSIHSINTNGFGEVLTDPDNGTFQAPLHDNFDGTWSGFVKYNIESLTEDDKLIQLGVMTKSESNQIKLLFENIQGRKFKFGLNHGDISLKNTIISNDGTVNLIDWGSAEVNIIPQGDLLQLLQCQIESDHPNTIELHAFLEGYGITQSDFNNMQQDLNELLLLRAFDKLRWAIDCHPPSIPDFIDYAKKVKARALNFAPLLE